MQGIGVSGGSQTNDKNTTSCHITDRVTVEGEPAGRQRSLLTRLTTGLTICLAAAFLASCGSTPDTGKVKFSSKKYGVKASPKVVASGKPVPKGGGRYMVGKSYKVAGKRYHPKLDPNYKKVGLASWYGPTFHGRKTANGEVFDRNALTAAHTTMPLPSYARVTNLHNGRSMIVRVNDRGPFHDNRVIDLSERVATLLGTKSKGVAKVKVEYVGRARLDGHDEEYLLASYRGPGAVTPGGSRPGTIFAKVEPPAPIFGPAPAPAPRPYSSATVVASAQNLSSSYTVAYDPALAFEASRSTIAVASLNTFRSSVEPAVGTVSTPSAQPIPAAYAEPVTPRAGILGVLPIPAVGTPRNLLQGSAVSSFAAQNRINGAHEAAAALAANSLPLKKLALKAD